MMLHVFLSSNQMCFDLKGYPGMTQRLQRGAAFEKMHICAWHVYRYLSYLQAGLKLLVWV